MKNEIILSDLGRKIQKLIGLDTGVYRRIVVSRDIVANNLDHNHHTILLIVFDEFQDLVLLIQYISFLFERCNTDVGIFFLFISLIAILVKVLFGAIPILTGMPVHCLTKVLI